MQEIYRHTDQFHLNMAKQLLEDHGIPVMITDSYTGALYAGVPGVAPRLLVPDNDFEEAQKILKEISEETEK